MGDRDPGPGSWQQGTRSTYKGRWQVTSEAGRARARATPQGNRSDTAVAGFLNDLMRRKGMRPTGLARAIGVSHPSVGRPRAQPAGQRRSTRVQRCRDDGPCRSPAKLGLRDFLFPAALQASLPEAIVVPVQEHLAFTPGAPCRIRFHAGHHPSMCRCRTRSFGAGRADHVTIRSGYGRGTRLVPLPLLASANSPAAPPQH